VHHPLIKVMGRGECSYTDYRELQTMNNIKHLCTLMGENHYRDKHYKTLT